MRDRVTNSGLVLCEGIGCYQLSDQQGSVIELNLRDVSELYQWFGEMIGNRASQETSPAPGTLARQIDKARQDIAETPAYAMGRQETSVAPVRTFTRVGQEMGMSSMCECGETFAKHIAQDHAGNACVCPTANRLPD